MIILWTGSTRPLSELPYDGVIVRTYTQAGLTVKEYDPVLTIADPSELEIHMELYSEDDFQRITPEQPVRWRLRRNLG